ncbi:hypothetical protein ACLOJK_005709 [Asimina triloba]
MAKEKRKGMKPRKKTKFEEFLEMDMKRNAVSAQEDLELERKLAKKLKVKRGKLPGLDDGINLLFDCITPAADSELEGRGDGDSVDSVGRDDGDGAQEAPGKTRSSRKKRKKRNPAEEVNKEDGDTSEEGRAEEAGAAANDAATEESHAEANVVAGNAKYVAPHLRSRIGSESEECSQMRRRVRGIDAVTFSALYYAPLSRNQGGSLSRSAKQTFGIKCRVNQTGDIYIVSIMNLVQSVGRSIGSQIIIEEVLASCSGGPRGNEQYAAVFAAFVAGMACLVGIDFSAKLIASLAKSFEEEYLKEDSLSLRNLTLLLSCLCIFGVCSRDNNSGLYMQMEFMLETICDIKNNKRRSTEDPAPHARLKKWLQKLASANFIAAFLGSAYPVCSVVNIFKASMQLRVDDHMLRGLRWSKLLDPDKKGQWWLSGDASSTGDSFQEVAIKIDLEALEAQKLLQLAAAQRMNTDARRAIFCVIMSGEDYLDAFEKILRLDLPGKQDREIMRVLVECCLQEKLFNKYYTVLASKLCSHDKNHKFTLQYCLWDHFKELETMELSRSLNLARFVAEMLSSFSLSLAVLKAVDLSDPRQLTAKRVMHFRMLFESLLERTDTLVWNMFTRISGSPELEPLRNGLEFFIKHYVVTAGKPHFAGKFKIAKKALNNVAGVLM